MIHGLRLATVAILGAVLWGAPLPAQAGTPTPNKERIEFYSRILKGLKNGANPQPRVVRLVKTLARLDPRNAAFYFKAGLQKLPPTLAEGVMGRLSFQLGHILRVSGLPMSEVKSISEQVQRVQQSYVEPTPTPAPYQALVPRAGAAVPSV
jgi:hypothetical protein